MEFSSKGNNAWLFQKAYYKGFNWDRKKEESYAPDFFKDRLNWLKSTQLLPIENGNENTTISLYTTYPGLATGVGVMHESKSKGELSLGFEFDYTTGMPIIRGHSIKGVLRAAFPQAHRGNIKYKKEKAYQIHCWIEETSPTLNGFEDFKSNEANYKRIVEIEEEIFEGKKDGKLLSNYQQDVFFDAYISKTSDYFTTNGQYLGTDSITPHIKRGKTYEQAMLTSPIPVPFLKVLPNVCFDFKFLLHDNGLLSIEQKKKLFTKILLQNGVGAKTNVGYGQLKEMEIILPPAPPPPKSYIQPYNIPNYKAGSHTVVLTEVTETHYIFHTAHKDILVKSIASVNKKIAEAAEKRAKKSKSTKHKVLVEGQSVKIEISNDFFYDTEGNYPFKIVTEWE